MATIIPPDGPTQEVTPADGVSFTLPELQAVVGGYIELVTLARIPQLDEHDVLIVNENGVNDGLPTNARATLLYLRAGGRPALVGVVGTVLRCRMQLETADRPERLW